MLREGKEMGNESLCIYVDNFNVWFNTEECKKIPWPPSPSSPGSANKAHEEERGMLEQSRQGWKSRTGTVQGAPWEGLGTVALLHLGTMLLRHCACAVLAPWLTPGLSSGYRGQLSHNHDL